MEDKKVCYSIQREIISLAQTSPKKGWYFPSVIKQSSNPKDIKSNTVCLVQINSIISDTIKEKECIIVVFRERNNTNEIHQSTRNRVTQYVRKDASLLYPGEGITPVNLLVD